MKPRVHRALLLASLVLGSTASASLAATPPSVSNGAASVRGHLGILSGSVVSTGGENPKVFVYWGTKDGGNDKASWEKSRYLGRRKAGKFVTTAAPLQDGATHYYRCYATNSAGEAWANKSISFHVAGVSAFSEEAMKQQLQAWSDETVKEMKKTDLPAALLWKEWEDQDRRGVAVTNWATWCDEYQVAILDPPIEFNYNDSVDREDISTPIKSLAVYCHARASKDGKLLFSVVDETAEEGMLKVGFTKNARKSQLPHWWWNPNCSHVVVLLTGKKKIEGNDYVLIWFRRQSPTNPTEDHIWYEREIFKKQKDKWLVTDDMSDSSMSRGRHYAGFPESLFLGRPYAETHEILTDSKLPPHFYTIDD